jgi:hypothetical protein
MAITAGAGTNSCSNANRFGASRYSDHVYARHVAVWPIDASNETKRDRVTGADENNGNC